MHYCLVDIVTGRLALVLAIAAQQLSRNCGGSASTPCPPSTSGGPSLQVCLPLLLRP